MSHRHLLLSSLSRSSALRAQRIPSIRHASSGPSRPRQALSTVLFLSGGIAFVSYYYDSRSAIHEHVIMPLVRATMDAETGHKFAVRMLGMPGFMRSADKGFDSESLKTKIWDLELSSPVGLAAGFDKDAEAIDGLFDLGFSYVEVGSVTPEPQPGNPTPRFFRLSEDAACINRYGFNSLGHSYTLHQLRSRVRSYALSHPSEFPIGAARNAAILPPIGVPKSLQKGKLLGVNLGKNKTSAAEDNEDYLKGVRMLGPYADILVINVSSPNTPGLRGLQGKDFLQKLLTEVVQERDGLKVDQRLKPKVVVKLAPDLDEKEIEEIAGAVRGSGVDGVIVSNTTVKREGLGLKSEHALEMGGLSGAPVKPFALLALRTLRPLLPPSIPLIACGGITTGSDALEFLAAGASFVQVYTSFGYAGVGYPRRLKDEIAAELVKAGGSSWIAEVGKIKAQWKDEAGKVGRKLEEEVGKLREVLKSGSFVPLEDVLAEEGQGVSPQATPPAAKSEEKKAVPMITGPETAESSPARNHNSPPALHASHEHVHHAIGDILPSQHTPQIADRASDEHVEAAFGDVLPSSVSSPAEGEPESEEEVPMKNRKVIEQPGMRAEVPVVVMVAPPVTPGPQRTEDEVLEAQWTAARKSGDKRLV